jgi:uncharacterized membrane protein
VAISLRKILALTVAVSAATLLMSTNALAWGCGGWNRSGSASFTGRYGNTYSANYSRGGSFGGGGYYGGGFRGGYVSGPYGAAYIGGVYRRPY